MTTTNNRAAFGAWMTRVEATRERRVRAATARRDADAIDAAEYQHELESAEREFQHAVCRVMVWSRSVGLLTLRQIVRVFRRIPGWRGRWHPRRAYLPGDLVEWNGAILEALALTSDAPAPGKEWAVRVPAQATREQRAGARWHVA